MLFLLRCLSLVQNSSFAGWQTQVNHEIDIELPASCIFAEPSNVCSQPSSIPGAYTCTGDYSTANLNNYIYTQTSGTGPAYSNMCVRASNSDGSPRLFMGDNQYHNYTIVWHTGDGKGGGKNVSFYIDGLYLGTNNAFVPTRGSRFHIAHWYDQGAKVCGAVCVR